MEYGIPRGKIDGQPIWVSLNVYNKKKKARMKEQEADRGCPNKNKKSQLENEQEFCTNYKLWFLSGYF